MMKIHVGSNANDFQHIILGTPAHLWELILACTLHGATRQRFYTSRPTHPSFLVCLESGLQIQMDGWMDGWMFMDTLKMF